MNYVLPIVRWDDDPEPVRETVAAGLRTLEIGPYRILSLEPVPEPEPRRGRRRRPRH